MTVSAEREISIIYTNHRGETSLRRIVPKGIRFAATEWHRVPQWLLDAFDVDKGAERSFAIADIREWKADGGGSE